MVQSSKKKYDIISPQELYAEIQEQLSVKEEHLSSTLKGVSSISTVVDAWWTGSKTFMSVGVNWIDTKNFQRISNIIGCIVFNESVSNNLLVERLHQTYEHYGISNKIIATVTNNHPQYDDDIEQTSKVTYWQIEGLKNQIDNPAYLFELIGRKADGEAFNDTIYAELHQAAFSKFKILSDYYKDSNITDRASCFLDGIFKHSSKESKVAHDFNAISNLINCDQMNLNSVLEELNVSPFTHTDIDFLKEYVVVFEPIATAIEYLQIHNCYYGTLLPMVYSMKDNLEDVRNRGAVTLCQALLAAILNGIEQYFSYLFDFTNEKCAPAIIATCTHPYFKMRWLKGAMKTSVSTNQILELLVKAAKEYDNGIQTEGTDQSLISNEGE